VTLRRREITPFHHAAEHVRVELGATIVSPVMSDVEAEI